MNQLVIQLGTVGILIVLVIAVRWLNGVFYKLARSLGYAAGRALGGRSSSIWLVGVGNLGWLAGTLSWLCTGAGLTGALLHMPLDILSGATALASLTCGLACVLYFALGVGQRVGVEIVKAGGRQATGLTDAQLDELARVAAFRCQCGHVNSPSRRTCKKCRAPRPRSGAVWSS